MVKKAFFSAMAFKQRGGAKYKTTGGRDVVVTSVGGKTLFEDEVQLPDVEDDTFSGRVYPDALTEANDLQAWLPNKPISRDLLLRLRDQTAEMLRECIQHRIGKN